VHWRRLIAHSDYVDMPLDETWGYAHNTQAASDTHLVCDWSHVDLTDVSSMPKCEEGECPGTNKDDMTTYGNFIEGVPTYTNNELLEFLSPLNDDITYVYDSFEWSHCDEQV
jgi:hypothetical protein